MHSYPSCQNVPLFLESGLLGPVLKDLRWSLPIGEDVSGGCPGSTSGGLAQTMEGATFRATLQLQATKLP